jgi:hypothetical protein
MSKTLTPKNSKKSANKPPRHVFEYADFARWVALPKSLRDPQTQRELALQFGVGEDTLSEWKGRTGFWDVVSDYRKTWGRERTPDVLLALFLRATKTGDPRACELWLEVMEGHGNLQKVECTHCQKYAEFESMTDSELNALIQRQQDFFSKK